MTEMKRREMTARERRTLASGPAGWLPDIDQAGMRHWIPARTARSDMQIDINRSIGISSGVG
jgi:hypothetical protein